MKKILLLCVLMACCAGGWAQTNTTCPVTAAITGTGRKLLMGPTSESPLINRDPGLSATARITFTTVGGAATASIEDGNDPAASVTPYTRAAAINATTGDFGFIALAARRLYINVTAVTTSITATVCLSNVPIAKAFGSNSTLSGFTQGSVIFAGAAGAAAQNNANLFWDNTNFRLGIGTTNPLYQVHIHGAANSNLQINSGISGNIVLTSENDLNNTSEILQLVGSILYLNPNGGTTSIGVNTPNIFAVNTNQLYLPSTGNVGIGTTAPAATLSVGETTNSRFQVAGATGLVVQYNNVAKDTNHNGTPFTTQSATATAQAANITATSLIASATAGRYRLSCYIAVTQQATTSGTVPNCNMICTDPTDSVAKTIQLTPAIVGVATNPTTGVAESDSGICDAKTATAIQYSTSGYASVGATPMQYKIYVVLETL